MNKQFEVLVASYKEPLDWLSMLPKPDSRKYKITVSNSAGRNNFPDADRVINIDNYGREAGHYLRFIIDNYDNLLPVTLFLQGDPWAHVSAKISSLLNYLFGNPLFDKDICYVGSEHNPNNSLGLGIQKYSPIGHVLRLGWQDEPIPPSTCFSIGAQFYVKKEAILKRPKDHYERIYSAVHDPDISVAHVIEGYWGSVFGV